MSKWLKLNAIYTFFSSPYSCHRTTLLNTKVLNFTSFQEKTILFCQNFVVFPPIWQLLVDRPRWQNSWNLVAQSVSSSKDTSAETTRPLVDSSIHDRLVKAWPLVDQTRFKFFDVSYRPNYGSVNFLLQYISDAIVDWVQIRWIRRPQCCRNEIGYLSRCFVLDAPAHRPVERQNPTLGYPEYVWQ